MTVDVELARPELDNAPESVGLQWPRGGEVDCVLDMLRVVAGNRIDVDYHRDVVGNGPLPFAVTDHREVRDTIAFSIRHVNQPPGDAGLDPAALLGLGNWHQRS